MSVMVSVVIPVYNIEQNLRQCLDSVAGQTLQDIEIICVDDGSTDMSPDILAEYAARDSRFHIIRQENAGPGVARNRGMEQATGKYLIFLDSDDWFEPDFLQCMVEDAEQTGADVTICRADEFDTNTGKVYDGSWMLKTQFLPGKVFAPQDVAQHVFQFTYGWPWDKLYRAKHIRQHEFRYPALPNSEDLVFVFASIALAEAISIVDRVLVHHRVNRTSSVSNSRHLDVEIPYKALELLRSNLHSKKTDLEYEISFVNWAMEFLVWNVSNLPDTKAQKLYFDKMKKIWFPAMNFDQYSGSYFENRRTYYKYLLAKHLSYPAFMAIEWIYKRWKKG